MNDSKTWFDRISCHVESIVKTSLNPWKKISSNALPTRIRDQITPLILCVKEMYNCTFGCWLVCSIKRSLRLTYEKSVNGRTERWMIILVSYDCSTTWLYYIYIIPWMFFMSFVGLFTREFLCRSLCKTLKLGKSLMVVNWQSLKFIGSLLESLKVNRTSKIEVYIPSGSGPYKQNEPKKHYNQISTHQTFLYGWTSS